MRRGKLLLGLVYVVGIGAFLGCVKGLEAAYRTASRNDYLETGYGFVAAKLAWAETLASTGTGALIAAAAIVIGLLSVPVSRIAMRSWRYGLASAIAAPILLALLAAVAWYVNFHYLPGRFEWQSIVANIGFAFVGLTVWFVTTKKIAPLLQHPALGRAFGIVGVVSLCGVLAGLALSRAPLLITSPAERDTDKPMSNVLIVMIDTLRPDRMSIYGYERPTTPNIDGLADDAFVFNTAISQAPWTKPAVASLFTGLYSRQHGVDSANWIDTGANNDTAQVDTLPPGVVTLAEVLSNVGYRTVAIGSNHHLVRKMGFDQGFDTYVMDLDQDQHGTRSEEINTLFLKWLRRNDEKPFLAYLHYLDVHWPFRTPPPYRGMYAEGSPSVDYNRPRFGAEFNDSGDELSPGDLRHMLDSYDEGIVYVDAKVGEILERLKQSGLYEDTMIIVVSDHGEEFTERGKLGHGHSLYDELLRVPLIVKFPCASSGCRTGKVDTVVELIDIMPTILHTVGMSMPADTMAELLPLNDSVLEESFAISEMGTAISLRTPRQKLIASADGEQVYDLASDPAEQHDLGGDETPRLADLRGRLIGAVDQMDVSFSVERQVVELDDETRRKLEALGYVD